MNLGEAVSRYEDFFIIEKGLSPNTYLAYRNDLLLFLSFLKTQGVSDSEQIRVEHILAFLLERGIQISDGTLNREKSVIKNFLQYCSGIKIVKEDFSALLKTERKEDFFPEVLTEEEMNRLFHHTENEKQRASSSRQYQLAVRNDLILEMLYALGLRVSELIGIRLNDISDLNGNEEGGWCQIHGKGSKVRNAPLLLRTQEKIFSYLQEVRPHLIPPGSGTPYLFLNKNGKKLSRIAIWKWVKGVALRCGISKNISPHTFRHTCATHLLQNGADLRVIQELVGHSNIQTTELYTHLLTDDIKNTFSNYHPLYR